jgi:hypothetical protein
MSYYIHKNGTSVTYKDLFLVASQWKETVHETYDHMSYTLQYITIHKLPDISMAREKRW